MGLLGEATVGPPAGADDGLRAFLPRFPDDDACLTHLWRTRFSVDGKHAFCSRCQTVRRFKHKGVGPDQRAWRCTCCGWRVYPTAGTIFEKSATGLHRWFYAAFLLASSSGDVSARRLQRELGVGYKTAWRMRDLLRTAMPVPGSTEPVAAIELAPPFEDTAAEGGGSDACPHNLPQALTRFIGRRVETVTVGQLVARERLVTLTGVGGCGKTRLALEVARTLVSKQLNGVWWVDLARLSRGELVVTATAGALGLRELPGRLEIDALVGQLQGRRAVIVLNNCEHLLDACVAMVEPLLGACPRIQLLATSREPLGIAGEVLWRVPPLSVPDRPSALSAEKLRRFDAIGLFVDRAAAADPSFHLEEANRRAVAQVCALLDGIPLAIEMAAAQVTALSVAEIAHALAHQLAVLTTASRSALPQHRTLRASMDWSHALLDEDERIVFRRLAVFVGGFSLAGAQGVCGDAHLRADEVSSLLTRLVQKSLVAVETHAAAYRYRLLEPVRQYAAERLAESDDGGAVRDRHLAFAVQLAEGAPAQFATGDSQRLELLDRERENLRAALDWAIDQHFDDMSLRLAGGLGEFFGARGQLREGRRFIADALDAGNPQPSQPRARALLGAARVAFAAHDERPVRNHAAAALDMACAVGDTQTAARALALLGGVDMDRDPPRARAQLAQSADMARGLGDDWCLAQALGFTSQSWVSQSALGPARESLAAAREVLERLDEPRFLAWHWLKTAVVACRGGLLAEAADALGRGRRLATEVGDPICLGWAAMYGAEIDGWRGLAARARNAALELRVNLDIATAGPILAMFLHAAVGKCSLVLGEFADAEQELPLAVKIAHDARATGAEGNCLVELAEVALLGDQGEQAITHALSAIRAAASVDDPWLLAAAKVRLGRAARAQGNLEQARALCHEALALQRDGGYRLDAITTLEALAGLAVQHHQHARAVRLLAAASAARRRLGARRRPLDALRDDPDRRELLKALDRATLSSARRDGRALSLNDAIAYALRGWGTRPRATSGWASLTPMELTIARLVASGHTNSEIAARTFVSRATVKAHISHILTKLAVSNRAELAAHAAQQLAPSLPATDASKK